MSAHAPHPRQGLPLVSVAERIAAPYRTVALVRAGHLPPRAIAMFLLWDDEPEIVTRAACPAALHENQLPDEPLFGAWLTIRAVGGEDDEGWRQGAVARGVANLGDPRRALIDGLACAPLACADGTIRVVRRRLPWTPADGDRVAILRQWTIPEYGARIRPHLERLGVWGVWGRMSLWGEYALN